MELNNRLLREMSLQNAALMEAMAAPTNVRQDDTTGANQEETGDSEDTMHQQPSIPMAPTPEKKRRSKKTPLEVVVARSPAKPPEGTPQKKKKKKVSESPASNPDTSNRYSPLRGDVFDDDDLFADANESNELDTVKETDEKVVDDDQKATATTPPPQNNSPGFGSNEAGQLE